MRQIPGDSPLIARGAGPCAGCVPVTSACPVDATSRQDATAHGTGYGRGLPAAGHHHQRFRGGRRNLRSAPATLPDPWSTPSLGRSAAREAPLVCGAVPCQIYAGRALRKGSLAGAVLLQFGRGEPHCERTASFGFHEIYEGNAHIFASAGMGARRSHSTTQPGEPAPGFSGIAWTRR
jgi:hypothetical protein